MKSFRLVMMGTGHFALPTLLGLYETGHQVVGLFTQPDRTGRGHHHHRNPLKVVAEERGTPVFQPDKVNTPEALADLRSLQPDICVVAAYGQILSRALLEIPPLGAINLHASILPRHRGAAPVQYAVLRGDKITGVTIFQIQPKLDAGPVLGLETTEVAPDMTYGDLELHLAEIAVPLTVRVLDKLAAGVVEAIPQDHSQATHAPRLKKEDGQIDWRKTPWEIRCHLRAMQPWPKPFSFWVDREGRETRMLVLEVASVTEFPPDFSVQAQASPGEILYTDRRRVILQTGGEPVELLTIQPEGKKPMPVSEFLNGHPMHPGERFLSNEHPL